MVSELSGVRLFVSDERVGDDREAVQLIAQAHYEHEATWVVFTPEQLGDEFFELRTGRAGAIAQKFVDYHMGLAVVGDIAGKVAASTPLADWVQESNRGRNLWFVPDLDALAERLQDGH
jgi:hypothetical protein